MLLPFVILNGAYTCIVHKRGEQDLPEFSLKHSNTLHTQCRHIEQLHEVV